MNNLEKENNVKAYKYIKELLSEIKNQKIIVSDGDETISTIDTSKVFFENNGLQELWTKNRKIFKEVGRNYEAYSTVAEEYTKIKYSKYIEYYQKTFNNIEIREYWKNIIDSELKIVIVPSGFAFQLHP